MRSFLRMRSRIVILLIFLCGLWSILIARAAFLQIIPNQRLQSLEKRQFETVVTLNARRGDIVDRNNHELAVSMATYSVFADPKIIEEPAKVRKILFRALGLAPKVIDEKIRAKKKRFVWIQRNVDRATKELIEFNMKSQKLRGLGFVTESKRVYPNDRLLSNVIGFVGQGEGGLEGLELRYNDQLQAGRKKVSVKKDARGRPLIVGGQMFTQAPDGADVQLTIDRELQFVLEEELQGAVAKHEADSAVGVVLDAQTSEVLAMASSGTFDPNKASDFSQERKRNKPVTDAFEPGSTMKTFVLAGALDKGLVQPNTMINCEGGSFRIGKRVIHEADSHHNFDKLTVAQILMHSSNIGTTKVAFKMGRDMVKDTYKLFGFGEKSGIDLPGESRGIIQGGQWSDHLLANISFGHGIAATPLQIANGYAAIANGGWLKKPYIVKSIRDSESQEVTETKPTNIRQVLTPDAAAKMRLMLTGVTSAEGSGVNARVPGYPVAGKTGTAQKVDPKGRGYIKGGYVSSFAGFLPANNPRFVIYVAVDRPRKGYYGGSVAAPVFSRVAKFAVRRAGIAPVLFNEENIVKNADLAANDADGMDGADSETASRTPAKVIEKVALSVQDTPTHVEGAVAKTVYSTDVNFGSKTAFGKTNSGVVTAAAGAAGSKLPIGPAVQAATVKLLDANSSVPDLEGLTLREVLTRISGTGVNVRVHGEGIVSKTIPAAGSAFASKELNIYLTH
ncbi:MAG: cell division protein [Proteobacteria bacterium]|nr:MAG: cell division protein [Pseudomonadota bacterium]